MLLDEEQNMRTIILSIVLLVGAVVFSQSSAQEVEATAESLGTLQTKILKNKDYLGSLTQIKSATRPSSVSCSGTCYKSSGTVNLSWTCPDGKSCDLHCENNPPTGGCW